MNRAYRGLLAIALLAGLGAVAVGGVGLYTVLTGETASPAEANVLGPYDCAAFEGDPEPAHVTDYEIEQRLLGGSEVATFDGTVRDGGFRANVTTEGRLLAASARRPDGANVTVRRVGDDRLVVEHDGTGPFRLWIDSIGGESTITRTELDVCP